jgi:hypothetical protein
MPLPIAVPQVLTSPGGSENLIFIQSHRYSGFTRRHEPDLPGLRSRGSKTAKWRSPGPPRRSGSIPGIASNRSGSHHNGCSTSLQGKADCLPWIPSFDERKPVSESRTVLKQEESLSSRSDVLSYHSLTAIEIPHCRLEIIWKQVSSDSAFDLCSAS